MEQINVTIQTEKGRIDKVLSEHLPNHSRSQIQQWLKEKHVTVNGETVRANYKVTAGDEIVVTIPEPEVLDMVAEDIPLTIVYEDNDDCCQQTSRHGRSSFGRASQGYISERVTSSCGSLIGD